MGLSPTKLALSGRRTAGDAAALAVHIPNPFTYLLMKLHAFHDRLGDPRKSLAAHHAVDTYRIVSMLSREEFNLVKSLSALYGREVPVVNAVDIVHNAFGVPDAVGILRLREGLAGSVPWSDAHSLELISALRELFPHSGVD